MVLRQIVDLNPPFLVGKLARDCGVESRARSFICVPRATLLELAKKSACRCGNGETAQFQRETSAARVRHPELEARLAASVAMLAASGQILTPIDQKLAASAVRMTSERTDVTATGQKLTTSGQPGPASFTLSSNRRNILAMRPGKSEIREKSAPKRQNFSFSHSRKTAKNSEITVANRNSQRPLHPHSYGTVVEDRPAKRQEKSRSAEQQNGLEICGCRP